MKKTICLACCVLILGGCANLQPTHRATATPVEMKTLASLSRGKSLTQQKEAATHLRFQALRETALSLGARGGLAYRAGQINQALHRRAAYLDGIFNFHALLLEGNIAPPVLLESRRSLNLQSPHAVRIADRSYKIVKQAKFVTTAPIWQNYLIITAQKPEIPDSSLLPKNRKEKYVWASAIKKGWQQGLDQANQIYEENLSRLKRDFQGMIRYRTLLAQHMVSAPQVERRDLGITGGGEALTVNDQLLTINALPSLQADANQWLPAVTQ